MARMTTDFTGARPARSRHATTSARQSCWPAVQPGESVGGTAAAREHTPAQQAEERGQRRHSGAALLRLLTRFGVGAALFAFVLFGVAAYGAVPVGGPSSDRATDHQSPPSHRQQLNSAPPENELAKILWALIAGTFKDPVAFWTLVLAVTNTVVIKVALKQIGFLVKADQTARIAADAAKKAADVAEKSLVDLEGPFLYPVIQSNTIPMMLAGFRMYDHPTSPHAPACPEIIFTLKNYGRTIALPQNVAAVFFFGEPEDNHNDHRAGFVQEIVLAPGESLTYPLEREILTPISREMYQAIGARAGRIFLRGSIIFSDMFGNRYEQQFCLAWDHKTDRFTAWGPTRNKRRRLQSAEQIQAPHPHATWPPSS